jgi:hypothetical protein
MEGGGLNNKAMEFVYKRQEKCCLVIYEHQDEKIVNLSPFEPYLYFFLGFQGRFRICGK